MKSQSQEVAVVPFCQTITNRLTKLLGHKQIRSISYPLMKLTTAVAPCERSFTLGCASNLYKVPCECGASYIGQKDVMFDWCKSTIAYHCWLHGHQAKFIQNLGLHKSTKWHNRITRESLEIALDSPQINQENGACLNTAWLPFYEMLKGNNKFTDIDSSQRLTAE